MKMWHGLVVAVAVLVIVALVSMTAGAKFFFHRGRGGMTTSLTSSALQSTSSVSNFRNVSSMALG